MPSKTPSLANDSFVDENIASFSYCLWQRERNGSGMTSAAQLLVRPVDVRSDESGEHPGEKFVMLTLTREELREMVYVLDTDWDDIVAHTANPDKPTIDEALLRAEFERMHRGRDLSRHRLRGTYCSPHIAALWNQHIKTATMLANVTP